MHESEGLHAFMQAWTVGIRNRGLLLSSLSQGTDLMTVVG